MLRDGRKLIGILRSYDQFGEAGEAERAKREREREREREAKREERGAERRERQ